MWMTMPSPGTHVAVGMSEYVEKYEVRHGYSGPHYKAPA